MNLNRSLKVFIGLILSLFIAFIILGSMEEVETFRYDDTDEEAIYLYNPQTASLEQIVLYLDSIIDTENKREIVDYVLSLLYKGVRSSDYEPTIPSESSVNYFVVDGRNVIFNLNRDVYALDKEKRLIMLSSIVASLVSFDSITSVEFYVEGMAMTDDMGQSIGKLSKQDVIMSYDTIEQMESTNEWMVYLPTESGKNLERQSVLLTSRHYEKPEEVLLNYLLFQDDRPIFGEKTTLIDVYTVNGICFVDMDESFQRIPLPEGISERIAIYSIVNSLSELEDIDYVQFMIDGEIVETFHGTLSLNRLLEMNYVLVE